MKMLDSCKVMYGKNNFAKLFFAGIVSTAIMLIGVVIRNLVQNEAAHDFIDGFCTSFGGAVNIFISVLAIAGAFGAVKRINPGYKYCHSIAGGREHFKRALISANLMGLVLTALYAAVGAVFYNSIFMTYMVFAALFVMGLGDLAGGSKHQWAQIVSFMVVGFVCGFIPGFLGEDAEDLPLWIGAALIGAGAVFYIICLMITLIRADRIWAREE
ncbi:MAG: hypothetical protein K2N56_11415 [Oscillospiraceae bacterium]|nr:hypothetical protein [Oscillospiraceae bacterium]